MYACTVLYSSYMYSYTYVQICAVYIVKYSMSINALKWTQVAAQETNYMILKCLAGAFRRRAIREHEYCTGRVLNRIYALFCVMIVSTVE